MSFSSFHRLCNLRVLPARLARVPSQFTMSTVTSTQNPEFKKRSVVSNFIFNFDTPDGRPKVALFRRSGQVSTYQHHLAPISGTIEKDDATPLAAAWREINEETTLTPASLALMRHGKSYTFSDPSIRREWTIYPFAWRLKLSGPGDQAATSKIKIDWEHESWDWYDPLVVEDSESFGGVPRLNESLRRVWFEKDLGEDAAKILSDGLDKLANDFTSGARQMAGDALGILMAVIKALPAQETPEQWWTNVRFAAWHIWKNGRESMGAAIMSALLTALSEIERTVVSTPAEFESRTQRCVDILTKQMESRNESASLVAQNLMTWIESTFAPANDLQPCRELSILTLSESSTIYQALNSLISSSSSSSSRLQNLTLDIRILESRPLFEGVSLASKLSQSAKDCESDQHGDQTRKKNHKITVYTDASAALASQGVHLVLIGADRVSSNGSVSNKTGTLPAVLSARYVTSAANQPARIIVLTESDKIAPSLPANNGEKDKPENHVIESSDPSYVIRTWESTASSDRIRASARTLISTSTSLARTDAGVDRSQVVGMSVNVQVQNISFEWCPSDLIDGYITEKGPWTVRDIAQHSAKLGAEEARVIGDL
ncbi:hypothetical protein V8F33_012226 [Rhypophila sp. PSN 637]